jgi:hypothetical protein
MSNDRPEFTWRNGVGFAVEPGPPSALDSRTYTSLADKRIAEVIAQTNGDPYLRVLQHALVMGRLMLAQRLGNTDPDMTDDGRAWLQARIDAEDAALAAAFRVSQTQE